MFVPCCFPGFEERLVTGAKWIQAGVQQILKRIQIFSKKNREQFPSEILNCRLQIYCLNSQYNKQVRIMFINTYSFLNTVLLNSLYYKI